MGIFAEVSRSKITMIISNAKEALTQALDTKPQKGCKAIILAGSGKDRARAIVVGPPNPDIGGNRRNMIIDVTIQDGKPVTTRTILNFRII